MIAGIGFGVVHVWSWAILCSVLAYYILKLPKKLARNELITHALHDMIGCDVLINKGIVAVIDSKTGQSQTVVLSGRCDSPIQSDIPAPPADHDPGESAMPAPPAEQ